MLDPHAKNPNNSGGISPSNKSSYIKELLGQKMLSLKGEQIKLSSQLDQLGFGKDKMRGSDPNKSSPNQLALETKLSLLQEKIAQINKLIDPERKPNNNFWGDQLN